MSDPSEEIRELRRSMGLSQREFGELLGLTRYSAFRCVSRWERGVARPCRAMRAAIAALDRPAPIDTRVIGERIRDLRVRLDLTQPALALALGMAKISWTLVSRWERGLVVPPPPRVIALMKLGLVSADEYLADGYVPPAPKPKPKPAPKPKPKPAPKPIPKRANSITAECPMCEGEGCGRCDGRGRIAASEALKLIAEIYRPPPSTRAVACTGMGGGVRRARLAAGLTQQELSDKCGIGRIRLGKVERGERNLRFTAREIAALERVLGPLALEVTS